MWADQIEINNKTRKNVLDFLTEKPKVILTALVSVSILIIALAISVIMTSGSSLTDEVLTFQEKYATFFIGSIIILTTFILGKLFLATYFFLVFKIFRYYLEFKVIASVVLIISIIESLGELVNSVSTYFFSTEYLTYLINYLNTDSFWMNVVLRPIEIFNLLCLTLLTLAFKRLTSYPTILIVVIVLPVVVWQVMESSFEHIVDILFS
jgi:hypothetical protein